MPAKRLTDGEGKSVLRGWPGATEKWSGQGRGRRWLRAQPIPVPRPSYRSPWLSVPGADLFTTQPDGLWVSFPARTYCDIMVIEVCRSVQNLNDKRSRYMHTSYSLILNCLQEWPLEDVRWKRGASARWKLASLQKPGVKFRRYPVRFASVLFALPNDEYTAWSAQNPPVSHEFYCPHSSLASYTSQAMQRFLGRMSIASHFYKKVAPIED